MDKKWDDKLNSRLLKRFCAVGLAFVLGTGLMFNSAFAAQPALNTSTINLNDTDTYSQRTKELVQKKWENAQISSEIKVYEKEYSFSPYSEAVYTEEMKNALMNFSNYLRWLGGLTAFEPASETVWSNAAKGAVLCQKNGDISHDPEQPDDMSDEFYDAAYQACSSSNLSMWYGIHNNAEYYMDDIISFLDDTSNVGSYELGHRFEFLQRAGYQIAYGSTKDILLQTVEDYNGQVNRTGTINGVDNNDYCYPWPAAGAFPTDAISTKALWSFNMNTDKIDFSGANITISITDLDTGKTIDVTDTIGTSAYLGSSTYFKGKCIYFQGPEADSFDGKHYQVTITGMELSNGDPAEITYTVDFFDPEKAASDKLEGVSCVGASLNLEGKIGINYYLKLSETILKDSGAYVEFVLPDGSVTKVAVSEGELDETTGEYKFTAEVAAKEMTDTIQCKVVDGSGKTSDIFEYSVIQYAKYVLEHESDYVKLVPLVRAMLTYGGAAQIHFDYQVDDLADADITLTEEEKELLSQVAEKVADRKSSVEGEDSFIHVKSASLTLESETEINYFFELREGISVNDLTFTCSGRTLKPIMMDDETCKVTVNRIAAKNLDEMFTVKAVQSGSETYYSATYGPYVYIHTVLSESSYSNDLKELCKALYWYSQAADTYFSK